MRSFEFRRITTEEFEAFYNTHDRANFLQSIEMAEVRRATGYQVHLLGVEEKKDDDKKLVAVTLLTTLIAKKFFKEAYVYGGPLLDYSDVELLDFTLRELTEFCKELLVTDLTIIPNYAYQYRNSEGQILSKEETIETIKGYSRDPKQVNEDAGAELSDEIIQNIKNNGFVHDGLTVGYTNIPRWQYIKNISPDVDPFTTYISKAKNTIRRSKISGLSVREVGFDELPEFKKILEDTAERRGFSDRSLLYYQSIYKNFGKQAHFMVVEFDPKENYAVKVAKKNEVEAEFKEIEQKYNNAQEAGQVSTKIKNAYNDKKQLLEQNEERAFRAKKTHDDLVKSGVITDEQRKIPVCSALFLEKPNEMVYFYSGSDDGYKDLYAPFFLQDFMLNYCYKKGIKRYNFYGIDGVFDSKDSEGYGVLHFKQNFNGYVEELLGEFSLEISRIKSTIKRIIDKIF